MLFPIRPALEQSRVFDGLNRLLRELMLAALEGRDVDSDVLPMGLYAAVDSNDATRELANTLRITLVRLGPDQKTALCNELHDNREPCEFLTDRDLALPVIPAVVVPDLKRLSIHLYKQTAKLVGVEQACGESIDDHSARFRTAPPQGNGNLCCVCGTEYLAPIQAGIDADEQWRGPYDHVLAKDDYPLFGVHPRNLLPACNTCNSRAKRTQDLLQKNGVRRLSFSPWTDYASHAEVQITIDDSDGVPRVVVHLRGGTAERQEKLDTWNEVYKIKARVEGEFLALSEKVAEDVTADDEVGFMADLERRARAKAAACRLSPFNYWRARVYRSLRVMEHASREALRLAIQQFTPSDQDMDDLFVN